jgi:hypothetical protein
MWAVVWSFILAIAGALTRHVLIAAGVSAVVYTGLSAGLSGLQSSVFSTLGGLPGNALNMLALLRIDEAVCIIFSALSFRLVLMGLTGGSLRRGKWAPGG